MTLTDRYTRLLLASLTLGAVLVPTAAAAQPVEEEVGVEPPCNPDFQDCGPECPPTGCVVCWVDDPDCELPEERPECPDVDDEDCPVLCVEGDPECPPPGEEEEEPDPVDPPVDPPVLANPTFTG